MNKWHINSIADDYGNDIYIGDTLNITDSVGKVHEVVVTKLALKDGMLFVNNTLIDIELNKERDN